MVYNLLLCLLTLNLFIMKIIKEDTQVKYIGKKNDWTFKKDFDKNSIGIVKNVFDAGGKITYQVEFDNGIIAPIEQKYLELTIT